MTPAQKAGFYVGDYGTPVEGSYPDDKGKVFMLDEDDTSPHPFWLAYPWEEGQHRRVFYLDQMVKLTKQEAAEYRLLNLLGVQE